MIFRFFICVVFSLILHNNYATVLQEIDALFNSEKYHIALKYYNELPNSEAKTLGILKCKFELKLYDNFKYDIIELISSLKKTNSPLLEEANILYGKYLVNINDNQSAILLLNQYKTKNQFLLGEKYNLLGIIHSNINKFDEAENFYHKSLNYFSSNNSKNYILKKGLVYNNLGNIYILKSKYDIAEKWYNEALKNYNLFSSSAQGKIAKTNYNLAFIYLEKNENYRAITLLEKSISKSIEIYGEIHSRVAECYAMLGSIYLNFNQLDKALDYFNKDKQISTSIYGEQNLNVAYAYFDCGMVYNQLNDFYLAKENLEKALNIRKQFLPENHEDIAENYLELIITYVGLNQLEHAKKLCNKILTIDKSLQDEFSIRTAEVYFHLGNIALKKFDFIEAEKYFILSNMMFSSLNGKNNKYKHEIYLNLSEIYLNIKDYKKAYAYAKLAIPKNKENNDEILLCYLQQYKIAFQQNSLNYSWNASLEQLKTMTLNLLENNNYYIGEKSNLNNAQTISLVCNFATEISFKLYQQTKYKKYIEYAFFFIESNKANSLLKQNKLSTDKNNLRLIDQIEQKQIALNDLKNNQPIEQDKINEIENQLFQLKHELEKNAKKHANRNKIYTNINIDFLQKNLNKSELYITYLVSENDVYRISISNNQLLFSSIKNTTQIYNLIQRYSTQLNNKKISHKLSKILYNVLLPNNLLKQKKSIVFSLDAFLHQVPFDALLDENNNCLIKNIETKYTFSYNIYFNKINKKFKLYDNIKILALAPKYDNVQFASLQNEQEITQLSNIFKTQMFKNFDASKKNYFKHSSQNNIIHFAAHTHIDSIIPIRSSLIVSNIQHATGYDFLTLNEIMQKNYNCKLSNTKCM